MRLLLPRIWELRHNLTAYAAAYVALAEALDCPLLTLETSPSGSPRPAAGILLKALSSRCGSPFTRTFPRGAGCRYVLRRLRSSTDF